MKETLLELACASVVGAVFGWILAHTTVADECKKLGKFYVGNTVFECRITNGG